MHRRHGPGRFLRPLLVVLLTLLPVLPVFASPGEGFVLMGSVSVEGGEGKSIPCVIRLEAEDAASQEALPDQRSLTVDTEGDFAFGPFAFTGPGMYYYRLYEEKGDREGVVYDDRVIRVGILCTNREDGPGVEVTGLVASEDAWQTKLDAVSFTNTVKKPPQEEKPGNPEVKTGDDLKAGLWILLTGLSLTGALLLSGRRRRREED